MKVKIAYTVDYEQVPEMMEDLLSSIRDELSASLQKLKFRPNDLPRMSEDFEDLSEAERHELQQELEADEHSLDEDGQGLEKD